MAEAKDGLTHFTELNKKIECELMDASFDIVESLQTYYKTRENLKIFYLKQR